VGGGNTYYKRREDLMPTSRPRTKAGKRYVRRNESGEFTSDQVSIGRSLAADRRKKAKKVAKKGQGDKGDRKR
jgi:hypothetical protein